MIQTVNKTLSTSDSQNFLSLLEQRFNVTKTKYPDLSWAAIKAKLVATPDKIWSLYEMEKSGGEPNLVYFDTNTNEFVFYDCALESPIGRRSLCYDRAGQEAREKKGIFPKGNALDMADAMGSNILTVEEYRVLQDFGIFDTKTSSWLKTPTAIHKLGGALFGDRRFDTVFTYHNSTPSFYSARGFRTLLRI